ncbi:MAG: zinc-dependent metalloprotease, partial [Planctomycetales bacterium]|nr:zinc-dependent metalloprotease [Planctomycetales bacterium]
KKTDDKKEADKSDDADNDQELDGIPERFIGPLLAELVAHEVGHTLGLRHNFVASSLYTLDEINATEMEGRPLAGSVMDYLPINMTCKDDKGFKHHTMTGVGPYDMWAIEYGYTIDGDLDKILARVAEPALQYGTDQDTMGPDPRARRYDFSKDPLAYAKSQVELAKYHRARLLDKFVKEGDSWAKAREGYEMTLSLQTRALSMMSNWVGGVYVHRDKKGDKNGRKPLEVVDPDQQRAAMRFVIDNSFSDAAFDLTPELLQHLSGDLWMDGASRLSQSDWPVHDRIMGIQSSALTMLMNPDTLQLVYDNELRTPDDQDALTLPELLNSVRDAIWTELEKAPEGTVSARKPWISSLRRNLQREHVDRLIDLNLSDDSFTAAYKPISNLALIQLQQLRDQTGKALEHAKDLDPYSAAHLTEVHQRISKALDATYTYNGGGSGGSGSIILMLGQEKEGQE